MSRIVARSGRRPTYQNTNDTVAYVETANTSQMSGLRKFGHSVIEFGYGKSQYASHGRPVWKIGNMPAHATANSVIASATRAIDMRHRWRKSSRMAEMSVPAWPMPIHQTKLTIAKPQPTGMFTPQIPVPFITSTLMAKRNRFMPANAIRKPINQPSCTPGRKTIVEIFSVTDDRLCPGSRTSAMDAARVVAAGSMRGGVPGWSVERLRHGLSLHDQ